MFTGKTAIVGFPDYLDGKISGFTNLHGWWKPPEYVLCFWANGCVVPYENDETYNKKRLDVLVSHHFSTVNFIKLYNFTLLSFGYLRSPLGTICRSAVVEVIKQKNVHDNAKRMLLALINSDNLSHREFLQMHFMTHDKTTLECAT